MQDEVVIEIASDEVPLMMEQTPSQDNSAVILDMTSPSDDDCAQVRKENYLDFVLQGFMRTDSFLATLTDKNILEYLIKGQSTTRKLKHVKL